MNSLIDARVVLTYRSSSVSAEEAARMRDVRGRILGNAEEVTHGRASLSPETGEYEGGVAFERSPAAISLSEGNRCFPLSTSIQTTRNMNAPQRGRKTMGEPLDEHAELVRDILQVSGHAVFLSPCDGSCS